ncbi:amidohydrolase family protein [Chelativorans sp. ZYF759]|uniref:amidohydrolase family protein n=1 Tax=Chelativorans sp. ZYF759 TaxID=2692213 RepID=UPI00145E3F5B|nr:amidohydrolase family protein [Chelativorans sp. ZYF759]
MNFQHSDTGENLWFVNARIPRALARGLEMRAQHGATGLGFTDFGIAVDGTLTRDGRGWRRVDLGGRIVLPTFIDSHVHLDKAYTVRRTGIPGGGLLDAVKLSGADAVNWTAQDLHARMSKALERAYLHGTSALRTHLDTPNMPAENAAWQVFGELQRQWRGRIEMQAVALMAIERVDQAEDYAERCRQIRSRNGVLGAFIAPSMATAERLDALFGFATDAALDVDFHVDETLDPAAQALELICDSILRTGFGGTVVAGHCCSLSTMPVEDRDRIIAKVVEAGVHVISLPHSNLFLQDRRRAATPQRRGITAARELRASGASIHFASDNVQDAFYPYGDYDMVEVFRSAVRAAHLDEEMDDWLVRQFSGASAACGFAGQGALVAGTPANIVMLDVQDMYDLVSLTSCDRVVVRDGRPVLPVSFNLRDLFAVESP